MSVTVASRGKEAFCDRHRLTFTGCDVSKSPSNNELYIVSTSSTPAQVLLVGVSSLATLVILLADMLLGVELSVVTVDRSSFEQLPNADLLLADT